MTATAKSPEHKVNPANAPELRVTEATRVSMNLPVPKLAVPEIPGYYLYWHLGRNVARALRAGYTFVEEGEVELSATGVANDPGLSETTSLGTRISRLGGLAENGVDAEELYLMKLPMEWHEKDMAEMAKVNEGVARSIREGNSDTTQQDPERNLRFMKEGQDLFYPRHMRRRKSPT